MLAPDQPLTITLQAQHWNTVMAALHEMPFRVAAPVIAALSGQLNEIAARGLANGAARDETPNV